MRKLDIYSQGDNSNTNHPYSLLTNTQGGVDGSSVDANQINDPMYALYAVLNKAGITPNNNLESVANSQFLQALTILIEETQLQPYKAGKTYNVGDTFTIGGVTHIVIPEADGLTAKFSDAVGAFAGLTSAQETALSNKRTGYINSLKAGYERFRAEAVPLHLYEKGISSPVVDGINLTDKYPKFFANCNGLNASGQYNTARKAFIDDNLPYLNVGGVYKTFDIPQGFGIVNNHNSIGTTTGGGDGAGISAVDNHLINHVTTFQLSEVVKKYGEEAKFSIFPTPTILMVAGGQSSDRKGIVYRPMSTDPQEVNHDKWNEGFLNIFGDHNPPNPFVYTWGNTDSGNGSYLGINQSGAMRIGATNMEKYQNNGGAIDKAWFDTHPNTGAGLQLGYYTLLKMV